MKLAEVIAGEEYAASATKYSRPHRVKVLGIVKVPEPTYLDPDRTVRRISVEVLNVNQASYSLGSDRYRRGRSSVGEVINVPGGQIIEPWAAYEERTAGERAREAERAAAREALDLRLNQLDLNVSRSSLVRAGIELTFYGEAAEALLARLESC